MPDLARSRAWGRHGRVRDRGLTPSDLRLIPHPAVRLVLVFGGGLRALKAEDFECLQVRLSPTVAHAVLGAAVADLGGAVVTLDDLCGREAARITGHLGDLSSWEDRFALTDAWLARRFAAASQVATEIAWAWRGIVAGRGSPTCTVTSCHSPG